MERFPLVTSCQLRWFPWATQLSQSNIGCKIILELRNLIPSRFYPTTNPQYWTKEASQPFDRQKLRLIIHQNNFCELWRGCNSSLDHFLHFFKPDIVIFIRETIFLLYNLFVNKNCVANLINKMHKIRLGIFRCMNDCLHFYLFPFLTYQ